MQIAMTMNLRAMLGLAARCHDDPILSRFAHVNGNYTANHTDTGITHASYGNYATPFYCRSVLPTASSCAAPGHLPWRMPCGMPWGRPAPAATTSVRYGVSLLGAETAAWRGLWSLARGKRARTFIVGRERRRVRQLLRALAAIARAQPGRDSAEARITRPRRARRGADGRGSGHRWIRRVTSSGLLVAPWVSVATMCSVYF